MSNQIKVNAYIETKVSAKSGKAYTALYVQLSPNVTEMFLLNNTQTELIKLTYVQPSK